MSSFTSYDDTYIEIRKLYGGSVNTNDILSIIGPNCPQKIRKSGHNTYIYTLLSDGTILKEDILSSDGINYNFSEQYIYSDTGADWTSI